MTKATKKAAPKTAAKAAPKAAPAAAASSDKAEKIAKTQIIEMVSEKAGLTRKQAGDAVNAALDVMVDALRSGRSVGLPGLGTFSVRATAARSGVRPGTSERIQIPAGKKVAFKVATDLKGGL